MKKIRANAEKHENNLKKLSYPVPPFWQFFQRSGIIAVIIDGLHDPLHELGSQDIAALHRRTVCTHWLTHTASMSSTQITKEQNPNQNGMSFHLFSVMPFLLPPCPTSPAFLSGCQIDV
jgi:hypothetical protein